MNVTCGQGGVLFVSLELLQDTQTGEMQKTSHGCFTVSHTRESQGSNEYYSSSPTQLPLLLHQDGCSCSWQCRGCVQPGDSTSARWPLCRAYFLAFPSLHGGMLGICKLSFVKCSLKMFFQTVVMSSAVSKSKDLELLSLKIWSPLNTDSLFKFCSFTGRFSEFIATVLYDS